MTTYLLHVVDQNEGMVKVPPMDDTCQDPYSFDFLFEVLTGPFAGKRGSHRELSALLCEQVLVLSRMVGICQQTGAILDWVEAESGGRWVHRHGDPLERALGQATSG